MNLLSQGLVSRLVVSLLGFAVAAMQVFPRDRANGDIGVSFSNVAAQAGITSRTIYGDERKNKYLLETTGCGAAFIDYDNDGWQDILLVNGTRLNDLPKGEMPT